MVKVFNELKQTVTPAATTYRVILDSFARKVSK
jgi:hypothetical protein